MKLTEILTKAQILAGLGVFEGNAIDQNLLATSLAIFHDTLNDINNDHKITLWQETWDYQRDNDQASATQPNNPGAGQWLNPFPVNPQPVPEPVESKFPEFSLPFPIQISYPLPNDCRRVTKAVANVIELRKTDFAEVIRGREVPSYMNMYAVNNNKIELVRPGKLKIVYAKEFPDFMPQDEVTLSKQSLSYVINLTAYNLALTFNRGMADKCQIMAEKSYNSLVSNLTVNAGEMYQNQFLAHARFDDTAVGAYW